MLDHGAGKKHLISAVQLHAGNSTLESFKGEYRTWTERPNRIERHHHLAHHGNEFCLGLGESRARFDFRRHGIGRVSGKRTSRGFGNA